MEDTILSNQDDNIIRTREFEHPLLLKSLGPVIFDYMQKYEGNTFLIDTETGETKTYGETLKKCIRTALKFKKHGVKPGDIICLCTYNQINDVIPYIAGIFVGAVVCSIDNSICEEDIKHLLKQVQPKIIFTVVESNNMIFNIKNDLNLDSDIFLFEDLFEKFLKFTPEENEFKPYETANVFDTTIILFSSGTTGLPKGICLTHYYFIFQGLTLIKRKALLSINLTFSSLYWISGTIQLITNILQGSTRLICREFDLETLWNIISNYEDLNVALTTNQAVLFLKSNSNNRNTQNLKGIIVGGSPVSEELVLALRNSLPCTLIRQMYGCTEAGLITSFDLENDMKLLYSKPKSCGKPVDGYWYKIVDTNNEEILGPTQIGELRIKTKCQMNGYYNMDSSNAWDSDRWLKTGDLCYYDEDYCFFVIDRLKEIIKYKGWHVSPAHLEGILSEHPAVKMAVVIGIPHKMDDEHPMGLVVLTDQHDNIKEEELLAFVNAKVDDRKKLRGGLKIVENVPQTPTGKIKRTELKKKILLENNICTYV